MRLVIRDQADAASEYVADYLVQRINGFAPTPARRFVLGLPTGSSPIGVYKCLVERYKAGEVSFENVATFNMDEYIGLPRDHPESYHSFMWNNFFSHVNVEPNHVHILDGNAPDLEAECVAYEAKIKFYGGIDLFLAGIGEDGHIAFNEPGSSIASRTRVKTLAYDTILANSRFFGNDVSKVPRMALTVGVQTILDAREVVTIILGARKALALQRCIEQGVNHMWTLSALQLHPHPMIVCDEDATLELQVKTVHYFKSIEKVARTKGFEQTLPQRIRTGGDGVGVGGLFKIDTQLHHTNGTNGNTNGNTNGGSLHGQEDSIITPTVMAPLPTVSRLLGPAGAPEGLARATTPDLVPDSMASRLQDPTVSGYAGRRMTPKPEEQ